MSRRCDPIGAEDLNETTELGLEPVPEEAVALSPFYLALRAFLSVFLVLWSGFFE